MSLEGTAGGRVPHRRVARVGIDVGGFTAASVAVAVASARVLDAVEVAGVMVKSRVAVKAVVGEDSMARTGVSVGGTDVFVGCAANVCATAVCRIISAVAAISTVGPAAGVEPRFGIGMGGSAHALRTRAAAASMTVFFTGPYFRATPHTS